MKLNASALASSALASLADRKWQRHSILVHIPKTGGTALESWGLQHGRYFGANIDRHNRSRPWNHSTVWQPCQYRQWNKHCCSWWHMPPKWFDDLNETLPLLAAVRDPVDRAISQARYQMRWEHRDYEDAAGVWCRNETFDRYIMERLRRSEQSRFMDDCHWIPQLEYVTTRAGELLPNILLVGTNHLSEEMAKSEVRDEGVLARDDWQSNPSSTCEDVVLNATTLAWLRAKYKADFAIPARYKQLHPHNDLAEHKGIHDIFRR